MGRRTAYQGDPWGYDTRVRTTRVTSEPAARRRVLTQGFTRQRCAMTRQPSADYLADFTYHPIPAAALCFVERKVCTADQVLH